MTRFQVSPDCVATKDTPTAKDSTCQGVPTNTELSQIVIIPPEAPKEGANTNLSNRLGQKVLIKAKSKASRLVSWIQSTEHPVESIAFLRAKSLLSEFMPLIFHDNTFHDLFIAEEKISFLRQEPSVGHPAASQ